MPPKNRGRPAGTYSSKPTLAKTRKTTQLEAQTSMTSTLLQPEVMESLAKAIATQMSQLPVNLNLS